VVASLICVAPDLKQTRRDPAQAAPELAPKFAFGLNRLGLSGLGLNRVASWSKLAMKRFGKWALSAGLVFAASAAHAQMLAPTDAGRSIYRPVSDFDGPYEHPYSYGAPPAYGPPPYEESAPPVPPAPVYGYGGGYDYRGGYGAPLLPPQEVYAVLRENGFSPLGIPHLRGMVYAIAAIDPHGENGRLTIDARNGRILGFMPAYGNGPYGENFGPDRMSGPGPEAALPPPTVIYGTPRPPAPVPHIASRTVPLPSPKPAIAAKPPEPVQPPQRSAAIEARPAMPPAAPRSVPPPSQANASPPPQPHAAPAAPTNATPPNATVGEAKPSATVVQPSQQMPPVQGFE
jgi:hypothetical protein